MRTLAAVGLAVFVGCTGGGGTGPAATPNTSDAGDTAVCAPDTIHLTISGFTTCSCFNGTFTLTTSGPGEWSSPPINGCPNQREPAFLKFVVGALGARLGIADATSVPGSGNSDDAPTTTYTCTPTFAAAGGGATAGNITDFCPSTEDEQMSWSLTP